jgi:hypothetical protein
MGYGDCPSQTVASGTPASGRRGAEGAAVKDEFVLPAELIDINQRQASLDDPRDRHLHTLLGLVAPKRRAVWANDEFRACFYEALDNIGLPQVLADRQAKTHTAELHRPGHGPWLEDTQLIEDTVIRQLHLVAHRADAALLYQEHAVVQFAVFSPGAADHQTRTIPDFQRERFRRLAAGDLNCGLQHQVLR